MPRRWAVASALLAPAVLLAATPNFRCITVDPALGIDYPARAFALLKDSGVRGNLAVSFDWALYALYHLGPGIKISFDGRRETAYSPEMIRAHWRFGGASEWTGTGS